MYPTHADLHNDQSVTSYSLEVYDEITGEWFVRVDRADTRGDLDDALMHTTGRARIVTTTTDYV